MNDPNRTVVRQQALLDEATPDLRVIATIRLDQPLHFRGVRDGLIDITWTDIRLDNRSLLLRQAIEALVSHTLSINMEAIVTRQHVRYNDEGVGFPILSISLPDQEQNSNRTAVASAAIALLSQASFSNVRIAGGFSESISPDELNRCQAIAKQISDKYLSGYASMRLSTAIDIELPQGVISCGGRILGSAPEIISATGDRQIIGNIVEWNTKNRCFSVKDGQEKAEWVFYDLGSDPWRALRDLLGEPNRVKVTAKQTLRKLRGGNEEAILSFDSFSVIQEELFPGTE